MISFLAVNLKMSTETSAIPELSHNFCVKKGTATVRFLVLLQVSKASHAAGGTHKASSNSIKHKRKLKNIPKSMNIFESYKDVKHVIFQNTTRVSPKVSRT